MTTSEHDTNATALLLQSAAARAAGYLGDIESRSVAAAPGAVAALKDAFSEALPQEPTPAADVLDLLDRFGSPATVASVSGRYFGFVTGGTLPATLAAGVLATAWDQNAFSHISSPAASVIEEVALNWVRQALRLPGEASGAIVTGATMANFTALAAARSRVLADVGWDVDADGLCGAPPVTVIVGAEVHAVIPKVLGMLGLGRSRVVYVPTDEQGRMRSDVLPDIDGPTIVCLQAGNVNSGAFDPASDIVPRAKAAGAWVHVDGAFGLWAAASPKLAYLTNGLSDADSWAVDAHKWLNVPYDSGLVFVRDREAHQRAVSMSGAYIMPSGHRDAMHYTPDSSRRARGIEVWAALKSLGASGLADMIDRHCRQTRRIAEHLAEGGVDVLNDVVLNQVVVAFGDDRRTDAVIDAIQADGTCWAGATEWRGRRAMRISVSNWITSDSDIDKSAAAMLRANAAVGP